MRALVATLLHMGKIRYEGRAPICRNSLRHNDLRQKKEQNNYFIYFWKNHQNRLD